MRAAAGIAAVAALALVAAAAPAQPVGTAQTRLTAAEVTLSGVATPVNDLTVLDVVTFASTDTDTARNTFGAPFSSITVAPATLGGTNLVPPVTVRSDGQSSLSTASLDQSLGILDASLNPIGLSATSTASSAEAVVNAATARLGVLGDALGVQINQVPSLTKVDATAATATNGIDVTGVSLDLGELLPVDLADLPLSVILELASVLSTQLDIPGVDVDALTAALADVEGALTDLESATAGFADAAQAVVDADAALATATTAVTDAEAVLAAAQADLSALEADLASLPGSLAALLTAYATECPDAAGALDPLAALTACLNGLIDDATADVATAQAALDAANGVLATAQSTLDAAVTALTDLLADISALVGSLDGLIDTLLSTLTDVLSSLQDILDTLPGASLLDVDPIAVAVSATANADGGVGTVQCGGGAVSVAGTTVVPDIDGCAAVSNAAGALGTALGTVEDVLASLTNLDVPTPELSLFTQRTASNGTDGAYKTASASIVALDLQLPSVDLDDLASGAVSGLLDSLRNASITELLNTLDGAIDADLAALTGVTGTLDTALTDVQAALSTALAAAGVDETALDDLLATVDGLVGGVIPDGLATPGVSLVVDPTATAEFAPAAAPAPPAPAPSPTTPPAPAPAPSLPATGGGLAILGALALAGGMTLRRR